MKRAVAREQAFILVFEKSFNDADIAELIGYAAENCGWETDEFMEKLAEDTVSHLDAIDPVIEKYCIGWKKERISKVSLSIMRVACNEIMFMPDIPVSVSIDEAVELAKTFDDDKAPAFVNGILNGIAEDLGLKK